MSSSLMSLNTHLLSKHLFYKSKFKIPNPPWSLGVHNTSHFVNLYFFLCPSLCQKNLDVRSVCEKVKILVL